MCCRCARHLKMLNDKALSQARGSVVGPCPWIKGVVLAQKGLRQRRLLSPVRPSSDVLADPFFVGRRLWVVRCFSCVLYPVSGCMRYITDRRRNGNKNHSHCSYNITLKEVGKLPGMPEVPKNRMQNIRVRTQNSRKKQGWNAEAGSEESSDSRKRSTAQRTRKN